MALSACSVTQTYKSAYTLDAHASIAAHTSESCRDKTLKVSQAFSKNTLMTTNMSYVEGEYNQYVFSESQWSQSPSSTITQSITQSVRNAGLFRSVQGHKSRSKSDYILESSIEDFMQYFSKDLQSSFVNVVIHFALIDAHNSDVLQSITLSKKVAVDQLDAKAGVKALSQGLNEILEEKNSWLNEVCR